MSQLLGIKFNDYGQLYYFSSGAFVVEQGHSVLVKTEQGMGLGQVVLVKTEPEDEEQASRHETIYRLANDNDFEAQEENHALSRAAFEFCRGCITEHKLEMKLVDVEVFFDRSKMVFYFTAPGRIDFRELIKDLVKEYRTRIELRQIGVRHETQMLGALGNCGQICCCRRFLRKFVPVTIKMAKEQNLFLNPSKISGICGRLLCCLSYEQEGYEEFNRLCPKVGKRYNTTRGPVKVLRSNFFKKTLTILPEGGPEEDVDLDDWQDMRKPGVPGQPSAPGGSQGRDSGRESGRDSGRDSGREPRRREPRQPRQPRQSDGGQGRPKGPAADDNDTNAPLEAGEQEAKAANAPAQNAPSQHAPSQSVVSQNVSSKETSGRNAPGRKNNARDSGPGREPPRGSIFGLNDPVDPDDEPRSAEGDSGSSQGAKPTDNKQPAKKAKGSGRKPKRRRKRGRPPKSTDSSS